MSDKQLTKKSVWKSIGRWGLVGLVFLFSFPAFYGDYGVGLDASYAWGLNWLFVHDYSALTQLTYPFGPLAFLKIPTIEGDNLLYAILFFSTLKLLFIRLLFKLSETTEKKLISTNLIFILLAAYIVNIDFLIIGTCLILNYFFYKRRKYLPFLISILLASIGLFIKVSIGITSFSIIGMSMMIFFFSFLLEKDMCTQWKHQRPKFKFIALHLPLQIASICVIVFTCGLIVFQTPGTFFDFLFGVFKLSSGYGDTLSIHPNNNWWLLIPFILLMVLFPIFNKEKDTRIFYLLALLPLLASWKHSFVREDYTHYKILIYFLIFFWSCIVMISQQKKWRWAILGTLTVLLLFINMKNVYNYRTPKFDIIGIAHFNKAIHYKTFKAEQIELSKQNTAPKLLNDSVKKLINNQPVDFYPWEHSYAAANGLCWNPRKTVEIGASTSQWASLQASKHYTHNENSPAIVLFHLEKDRHGGKFGSIDDRHILNDEPLVIYNLLNNYRLIYKSPEFLLFKQDTTSLFADATETEKQKVSFNEWIDITPQEDQIIRLKVFSKNTLWGKIKKMLYKEEEYYIDYQLENGHVLTYRYVPGTAVDGLWCSPFIAHPENNLIEKEVKKIRLRNSNPSAISDEIEVQFQFLSLKEKEINILETVFEKHILKEETVIIDIMQDFENIKDDNVNLSSATSYSGQYSNKVEANGYSYTYTFELDSLWQKTGGFDTLKIEFSAFCKNNYANPVMVISGEGTADDFWDPTYPLVSISKNDWHAIYTQKIITREKHAQGIIKIYVANSKKPTLFVDNLRITVSSP